MNCRDVERRLSAYLDGELDESAASALRGHLRLCEACRHIAEAHAAVVEAVATLPTVEPPSTMWDGVLARLGEAEVADAQRPSYWLWWRRVRPHLLTGVALAGAAATFSLWMWKRGELPLAPATDVAIARAAAPAAADTELAAQAPGRPADAPAGAIARDVTDALADDSRALDDSYRTAAEELVALAAEERPAWTPDQVRAFDTRLTGLRAAIDAAPVGSEPRERAWQALIGFLQRAATGERLVAWNGEGR